MAAETTNTANMKYAIACRLGFNIRSKNKMPGYVHRTVASAVVLALPLLVGRVQAHRTSSMDLVYTWAAPTFVFQSEQHRQELQSNGTYVPGNSVPFDVDVGGPNRSVFVAMPWMMDGSPVTLATVEDVRQRDSPRLVPYPDWSWHAGARGCDGLTSVFRTHADACGRLWVVDSGVADVAGAFRRHCPAQLLAFDLATGVLLLRHRFPGPEASCAQTLLLNVAVEQLGSCGDDAYAYVADTSGYVLYVYSMRDNSSWRVPSDLFFPDVNERRFRIAGSTFDLMDGVLALALSPALRGEEEDRLLFFHSTSSRQEGVVRTSVLRNRTLFADGGNAAPDHFHFIGERQCQAAGEAMDSRGVLFYSPLCANTIVCWNSRRPFTKRYQSEVDGDDLLLRFVASLKVISRVDGRGEELWAVANNAHLLFAGEFSGNVTSSFNILRGSVRELVAGTRC